eukprot:15448311-Alexandrium_andersonii.AAC.1
MPQSAPRASFGGTFEAVPGPAQFQVRTPEAILHVPKRGLRIEADCSPGEHWVDCGLHVGHTRI